MPNALFTCGLVVSLTFAYGLLLFVKNSIQIKNRESNCKQMGHLTLILLFGILKITLAVKLLLKLFSYCLLSLDPSWPIASLSSRPCRYSAKLQNYKL